MTKQANNAPPREARQLSVSIARPPAQVYAFVIDKANLPRWASGLSTILENVRFAEENSFGVLDHDVLLESGETIHNPMRVVANHGGSEVVFTLVRREKVPAQEFAADAATVQQDLVALKQQIEDLAPLSTADAAQHPHHAIDYIELTVTDLTAAMDYYAAAFGWRFNPYGPNYAGIQGSGREVGGLRADAKAAATPPLVLLYSRDLDATLQAVRKAGGRVVQEPYAFPGGRRFHFRDPGGNELAVWSHADGHAS